MQLAPGNLLAWELYHQSRLPGVGDLILELRGPLLEAEISSSFDREGLAQKLDALGSTYAQIEADEAKKRRDDAEIRRRIGGRS